MAQQIMLSRRELEKTISEFMLELGIPAHLRGVDRLPIREYHIQKEETNHEHE